MRNNVLIAAAVGAVLASTAVSAATVDIYVSGSSAAKTFFQKDVQNFFGGATNAPTKIYTYKDAALTTRAQPDYSITQVTVANTQGVTGLNIGDTLNMHYAAELGSTWGVAGAYNTTAQTRAQLALTAGCSTTGTTATTGITSYTCAGSNFNHVSDTDGAATAVMVAARADILFSDVEPALFTSDNWPSANTDPSERPAILATVPTVTQLNTAKTFFGGAPVLGQVFAVIGHNIPGVTDNTRVNMSSNSIRAILTGNYTTWNQVPEVGANDTVVGGTPIFVCRRDHGSGTEIAASVTFVGAECGVQGAGVIAPQQVAGTAPALTDDFQENPSTGDIVTCVTGPNSVGQGTIAIRGNTAPASNFAVFNVDGVEANAHNAAAGMYPYAYEAWGNVTGAQGTGVGANVAAKLFSRLQSTVALATYSSFKETVTKSSTTEGTFTVGAVTNNVGGVYGLSGLGAAGSGTNTSNTDTGASIAASTVPTALFSRAGISCALKTNSNL